ncbi:MAG TPA: hypothetical protein HA321_02985 [Halobacteriales archaeon]|jgi:small neutral amino acid transporter SnatA (MarC family)|uniref:EMC6-like membrane protein n=1 Tax=Candidatus Hikarchaeum yamanae TaxID=2675326 RepID=UPI0017AE403C|nr:hypothetical protein [Halobacteriales archaeon]HIJ12286.1 hypothetical protein [Halobacteriales archaeon]
MTLSKREAHLRSLRATGTSTIVGIVAALVTHSLSSGPSDILISVPILIASLFLGLGIMQLLGVNVSAFSKKDHFYVSFMTFTMWFVTWTLLLTANVSF